MGSFPGYQIIEEFLRERRFILYRARRLYDKALVLIKSPRGDDNLSASIDMLRNEYNVLKDSNLEGVIGPIEILDSEGGISVVFEDATGIPLRRILDDRRLDLQEALTVVLSVSKTLLNLREARIVHGNISPWNIIADLEKGLVRLTGFDLATSVPMNCEQVMPKGVVNGALAYMSPEQTGRVNRLVDYRSDYYSLGVTFYEMLTGLRPFVSSDRMELIHQHIAKEPETVSKRIPGVPEAISRIVTKLLAKNPDDRYQSAAGLHYDLKECLSRVNSLISLDDFQIGSRDHSERPRLPTKVYGREREFTLLREAVVRVSRGSAEMVLVSGAAGIGKTVLVQEIREIVYALKGYFVSGKFDQLRRDVPYDAVVMAFRELLGCLLAESEGELSRWKTEISRAVGMNALALIEVIPDLEIIVQRPSEVKSLGTGTLKNRLRIGFRQLIRSLCKPGRPLVIFLDDLQWVDRATLELLEATMADYEIKNLLLVGAYRHGEVMDDGLPLFGTVETLKARGVPISEIALGPLAKRAIRDLLTDIFADKAMEIDSLAEVLSKKTDGNPFLLRQLLETSFSQGLVCFDRTENRWRYEIRRIKELGITENIVDLLIRRLRTLPAETQDLLRIGACLGNPFALNILAVVVGRDVATTGNILFAAEDQGLVVFMDDHTSQTHAYNIVGNRARLVRFIHDRVQQAAYELIDPADREATHLEIGRALMAGMNEEEITERIFEILGQLNMARRLVVDESERERLVRLNLVGLRKAEASGAFDVAFSFAKAGAELIGDDWWNERYELAMDAFRGAAGAACLAGRFREMEIMAESVKGHARTPLELVDVYRGEILAHMARNRPLQAIECGREILEMLGEQFAKDASVDAVKDAIERVHELLSGKSDYDITSLPDMENPEKLAITRVLADIAAPAYFSNFELWVLIVLRRVELMMTHGKTNLSPYFCCGYGMLLCGILGDVESGYRFGSLGLKMLEQEIYKDIQCRTMGIFDLHIRHFKEHIIRTLPSCLEAYEKGLESGDLEYAAFAACTRCWHAFFAGCDLEWVQSEMETFEAVIRGLDQQTALNMHEVFHQAVLNLVGDPPDPTMLVGDVYDEREGVPKHTEANDRTVLNFLYLSKGILNFLYGRNEDALHFLEEAGKYIDGVTAMFVVPIYYYYDSLVRLALLSKEHPESREELGTLRENQDRLKDWSGSAAVNHLHRWHLVEGEICKIRGQVIEAIDHYESASRLAQQGGFVNDQGVANELTGRFWIDMRQDRLAAFHLREAHRCFSRWGAKSKVKQMEEAYPSLLAVPEPKWDRALKETGERGGQVGTQDGLDLITVMKASQALSAEIVLDRLLKVFMRIVLENVGAEAGVLLLNSGEGLFVKVRGRVGEGEVVLSQGDALQHEGSFAASIVQYVARTLKNVVLDDATDDPRFCADPRVVNRRAKSVLCAPILHKGSITGVLYLENNLMLGAFTADRTKVVEILAGQIGVSIENARLYDSLRMAEEKYRSIFENAVEGIYQTTLEGRIVSANPAMARILGFDSTSELMEQITDIGNQLYVLPERRRKFLDLIAERRLVTGFEVEFYRRDGSRFWASLHARPIWDESGKVRLIEGILSDITEQKKTVEALREREEHLVRENIRLKADVRDRYKFGSIVGKSGVMQEVYEVIVQAAGSNASVIIYGESGTGKELVARAIHEISDRKEGPFVPVNCGAIPENLSESEFFGYRRGAFTGATGDKQGYLDLADGGTLFMDELGEVGISVQAKLLRAIEGGGYRPVGGTKDQVSDFRVIAATNRDLRELVRKGSMREDFFYRIHVIPIYLPPLRERKEDIPLLVEHFLKTYEREGEVSRIAPKTLDLMMKYDWPGNVRELQNTLHRFITLGRVDFLGREGGAANKAISVEDVQTVTMTLHDAVRSFERKYIQRVLEQNQWHRTKAAKVLGIGRRTLFRKIENNGPKMAH